MNALIRSIALSCAMALAIQAPSATAAPVGTEFTYQGRLQDGAQPAMGLYDFEFRLHSQLGSPGGSVTAPVVLDDVPVENGVFSVVLDFGAAEFIGDARWLSIAVRDGDSVGAYETLSPRQKLTAAPYALYALSGNPGPQGPASRRAQPVWCRYIHSPAAAQIRRFPPAAAAHRGPSLALPYLSRSQPANGLRALRSPFWEPRPRVHRWPLRCPFRCASRLAGRARSTPSILATSPDAQVSVRLSYAAAASTSVPGREPQEPR
ncbi:MAG: hypothetical protein IPO66_17295 [Rhodanobacteraceae bacterium]|nr:hypothetical protein [Rhodanobacteraceae bacterium]